jgi:hypothetical protein
MEELTTLALSFCQVFDSFTSLYVANDPKRQITKKRKKAAKRTALINRIIISLLDQRKVEANRGTTPWRV